MEGKYYFSYRGHTGVLKNKLEKAIIELLKENERKVIAEKDLPAFKMSIIDGIAALNAKFSKCKPRNVDWWDFRNTDKGDSSLSGIAFTHFMIYASK